MGPQFRIVNAINDDTIYASSLYTNLRPGPVVLTIPATPDVYSILPLNVFGSVINTSIPAQTPGTYALVLKGWRERFPPASRRWWSPTRSRSGPSEPTSSPPPA